MAFHNPHVCHAHLFIWTFFFFFAISRILTFILQSFDTSHFEHLSFYARFIVLQEIMLSSEDLKSLTGRFTNPAQTVLWRAKIWGGNYLNESPQTDLLGLASAAPSRFSCRFGCCPQVQEKAPGCSCKDDRSLPHTQKCCKNYTQAHCWLTTRNICALLCLERELTSI